MATPEMQVFFRLKTGLLPAESSGAHHLNSGLRGLSCLVIITRNQSTFSKCFSYRLRVCLCLNRGITPTNIVLAYNHSPEIEPSSERYFDDAAFSTRQETCMLILHSIFVNHEEETTLPFLSS